jgi:hypothetical protein
MAAFSTFDSDRNVMVTEGNYKYCDVSEVDFLGNGY